MDPDTRSFRSRLNRYICPALLGASVCFAVIYALYRPMCVLYTVIFLAAEFLLFTLFDKLKSKKTFGGLMYMLMLTLVFFGSFRLLYAGAVSYDTMILTWFYGEQGSFVNLPYYLNAVFLFGGFFVISILYYFTQVRYRSLGVMLSILFPFVIYAKRAEEVPEVLVTIIITLFIAVMVHNRRIDPALPEARRGRLSVDLSYIISMALFVSITGAVTMMIEKPEYQSQLERNSNYFDVVQTNGTGSAGDESLSETSSQRYGLGQPSPEIIFYFDTFGKRSNYFLRRQSYDYFNGERWDNESPDGRSYDAEDYGKTLTPNNPEYLFDDIAFDMAQIGYISQEEAEASVSRVEGRVYDDSFSPMYLPAPYATIIDEAEYADSKYTKYKHGEIFRKGAGRNAQEINESFEFFEPTDTFFQKAVDLGLSGDEFVLQLENNDSPAARRLLEDYTEARERYGERYAYADDRVTQLAYEITKDCDSDVERASALETYFEKNGYSYDIEYVPEDQSIEYFIFESKTGTCTSYATAMTIMARSIGLPARYVEGYAAFEKQGDNTFVIRSAYAHAWVEVYIPGSGWVTFDPTVSGYMQIPEDDFDSNTFLMVLGRFLVVIIVAFVIIFILLLDRIIELLLRLKLKFKTPAQRTLLLYANVIKLVNFSTRADYSAYTIKMLREYLNETRGACPEKLLQLFERTCFGGYSPTAGEFNEAYAEYKKCYKYLRKIPKQKKLEGLKAAAAVR